MSTEIVDHINHNLWVLIVKLYLTELHEIYRIMLPSDFLLPCVAIESLFDVKFFVMVIWWPLIVSRWAMLYLDQMWGLSLISWLLALIVFLSTEFKKRSIYFVVSLSGLQFLKTLTEDLNLILSWNLVLLNLFFLTLLIKVL